MVKQANIQIWYHSEIQVDGLAQVQVLVLEYSRTNTRVENVSLRHVHDTTVHAVSLNT